MVARSFVVGLALAATASTAAVPRSEETPTTWAVSGFACGVQWHSSTQQYVLGPSFWP